jgi:hypothetical protein
MSVTFNWTSSLPDGVYGTDAVIFGDPIYQPDTKIRVLNEDCDPDNQLVSLRPNRGGTDFTLFADFLLTQPDPVAILHFDK